MVARSEVKGYTVRLAWVKTQMEHARGVAQAAAYGPGGTGKDASGDVYMNSVEAAAAATYSDDGGLAWALANAVEQGDWAQAESLQIAIFAVKGGKGGYRKGLGKGKPGQGAAPPAAKGAGSGFNGVCNHCGIWGHRLAECRKLSQELGKKGGAKGEKGAGKGGKGGSKGGKGPPAEAILGVAGDEGDWAAALAGAGACQCGGPIALVTGNAQDGLGGRSLATFGSALTSFAGALLSLGAAFLAELLAELAAFCEAVAPDATMVADTVKARASAFGRGRRCTLAGLALAKAFAVAALATLHGEDGDLERLSLRPVALLDGVGQGPR